MICPNCGYHGWLRVTNTDEPDQYEKMAGIVQVKRSWLQCARCTLYWHERDYPLHSLFEVYDQAYRCTELRGETLEESHSRIMALPAQESENKHRVYWLTGHICRQSTVIDVGAGLNVFMSELRYHWPMAEYIAVEPCAISAEFIRAQGMTCHQIYGGVDGWTTGLPKADLVSCIHTLEHMEKPWDFIKDTRDILKENGWLFIEVPDAKEFDYLDTSHDEFNSTHNWFYNHRTIVDILESEGYSVTDVHKVYYPKRNLSRLMVLAKP